MEKILLLGASSTIAADMARLYRKQGKKLFLVGRNPQKIEALSNELGSSILGTANIDFNNFEEVPEFINNIIQTMRSIDLVIIAHGDLGNQLKSEKSFVHAKDIFYTNCLSVISLLIPIANFIEKQGFGQIAVIGSVAGERGRPRNYTYGAAKGSIQIYLQGLRSRLWKKGIGVHYIKLGPVDTPMTTHHEKNFSFTSSALAARKIIEAIEKNKKEAYVP
ncbi:MAG: SDR family NAD(P)-dependent oxidoreductase, partial [Leptospiraceae bacterium]|nr:SDR family NAD(P)-dependent oxidoreductase [Leptospiraceae bacterium]